MLPSANALVLTAGHLRALAARLAPQEPDAEVAVGWMPQGPAGAGIYAQCCAPGAAAPIPLFETSAPFEPSV